MDHYFQMLISVVDIVINSEISMAASSFGVRVPVPVQEILDPPLDHMWDNDISEIFLGYLIGIVTNVFRCRVAWSIL